MAGASTERSSVDRFGALFSKSRTRLRGNCSKALNLLRSHDRSVGADWLRAGGWSNECHKLKRSSICIAAGRWGALAASAIADCFLVRAASINHHYFDDKARTYGAVGYDNIAGFVEIDKAARWR